MGPKGWWRSEAQTPAVLTYSECESAWASSSPHGAAFDPSSGSFKSLIYVFVNFCA